MHKLRAFHLFAGAGGGILADKLLGHIPIGAVEIDPYCIKVLSARQADGSLPWFPIFDDVREFDGRPWRGKVDILAGGFPCQDISCAGRGDGIDGEKSGLWGQMARIIDEIRPRYVFVENSPMLIRRGLARVLADIASLGYDAEWCLISASNCGAPHQRDRIWLVAESQQSRKLADSRIHRGSESETEQQPRALVSTREKVSQPTDFESSSPSLADTASESKRKQTEKADSFSDSWQTRTQFGGGSKQNTDADCGGCEKQREQMYSKQQSSSGNQSNRLCETRSGEGSHIADPSGPRCERFGESAERGEKKYSMPIISSRWPTEPSVGRVVNGLAHRVDRLRALGNGQVPRVAAAAFDFLA